MIIYKYIIFIMNILLLRANIFGNYIQSYSITLIKRCKDLLLSNLFITFAL